jgi:steroid delta-isomerase-like uncharacterized protein
MSQRAGAAAQAAERFFAAYNRRDVPSMVALFAENGVVEYVPLKLEGPATEIGPANWGVLVDAFPDLRNEVLSVIESADARFSFVDVMIGGGQTKDAFGIANKGRRYWLRHMFVFAVGDAGQISRVTSYWDSVDWYTQLGRTRID